MESPLAQGSQTDCICSKELCMGERRKMLLIIVTIAILFVVVTGIGPTLKEAGIGIFQFLIRLAISLIGWSVGVLAMLACGGVLMGLGIFVILVLATVLVWRR